ncbi:MAG: energy transducer TonB [Bacteroidetes bacterium]|nr:energy transducer TonB [Bacteroidota bacterium]MBU1720272.1 energy transducer TonB [Bacteroidota bacterium]
MKTIATLIMAALLTAGTSATAGEPDKTTATSSSVSQTFIANRINEIISSQITYPIDAKLSGQQGKVFVSFFINYNGEVEVLEMNAGNEDLKKAVTEQLTALVLANPEFQGRVINACFDFTLK